MVKALSWGTDTRGARTNPRAPTLAATSRNTAVRTIRRSSHCLIGFIALHLLSTRSSRGARCPPPGRCPGRSGTQRRNPGSPDRVPVPGPRAGRRSWLDLDLGVFAFLDLDLVGGVEQLG